jgi:hypothetical protein
MTDEYNVKLRLKSSQIEARRHLATDTHTLSKTSPCIWWVLVWIVTSTSICWGMFIEMFTLAEGNTKWILQKKYVIATFLVFDSCLLLIQLALANARDVIWQLHKYRSSFLFLWMNCKCLSWYLTCACKCKQLALANARRDVWQRSTLLIFFKHVSIYYTFHACANRF